MKQVYYILLTYLFTLTITAQVKISLMNTSGFRLETIILNGVAVGAMENNEMKIVTLDSVTLMENSPVLEITAVCRNENLKSHPYIFCGSPLPKMSTVTKGNYNRDIIVSNKMNGEKSISLSIGPKSRWTTSP